MPKAVVRKAVATTEAKTAEEPEPKTVVREAVATTVEGEGAESEMRASHAKLQRCGAPDADA